MRMFSKDLYEMIVCKSHVFALYKATAAHTAVFSDEGINVASPWKGPQHVTSRRDVPRCFLFFSFLLFAKFLALFIFIVFGCHNQRRRFGRARKSVQPFLHGSIHTARPAFDLEDSTLQHLGGIMDIIGEMVS
jgi:hypothetical protein